LCPEKASSPDETPDLAPQSYIRWWKEEESRRDYVLLESWFLIFKWFLSLFIQDFRHLPSLEFGCTLMQSNNVMNYSNLFKKHIALPQDHGSWYSSSAL
jgi:hypothetical protein